MRKLVIALAAGAGLGLLATSGALAVPANGAVIDAAAAPLGTVEMANYRRGGWHCPPRRCWRWVCHKVYRWHR